MSLSFADAAKAKELRDYFNRYGRIYIVVDATGDDVVLPDNLKGDPALRLVLSLRMPQQIHIRDDRLDSDFSFSGQIYACRIPMHTIWAAYQPEGELEQGIIWDDSVPEIIKSMVQAVRSNQPDDDSDQPSGDQEAEPAAAPSPMTVIEGGGGAVTGEEPAPAPDAPGERKVSHLRVVK
ncbi:MAG: hypothetical protein COW18_13925 [Zetaproteobacteria bacterium CG12_big_fil_rev_8_21_14_0_65_54_13]|nr:MAG: hypothetical protein COX55_01390 [Zetaproteobacteria bacterium CG23_combo_of_CG06-09_8_20_14_all_54_7]PIW44101.1 MAG: hypothetical protein COW18_13925 [Zetaproteobacteria bacterium CG12_big_fil_rev_8_21_14_0_65_54_13]PIX54502.1 MAG: hypothetical protein COZ50_07600 [Zetaproteobacteria bacterium CG_4_10_14_3_um_filter_54_28]PJA28675.1 MAG: hypothetical protein CO188_08630 [Zetaproteobacteria bacterium CG_4_9_14_3_um_filter_54_145]